MTERAATHPATALSVTRTRSTGGNETNADGTIELPMPTVVIVDTAEKVRWLDIHADYTTRSEPEAILNALDETSSQ